MEFGWLYNVSRWISDPMSFVAILASAEIGRRLRDSARARRLETNAVQMTIFEAAFLGHPSLMIGFTAPLALSRVAARKAHSLDEKNVTCFPLGKIPNVTGCSETLNRRRDQQDFRKHEEDAISLERV